MSGRWLLWILAPLLLFLPLLLLPDIKIFGNSDALFYSNILAMVGDSLKAGVPLPRWLPEGNAGFGSPVMLFYTPLAYLTTALLELPLTPLQLGIGAKLLIGIYASQVVSGYTSFLWLRQDFSERIAFIGSLLFVLLPYKLIYIYLHINLAQLWALAILPLWMMAARDMIAGGARPTGVYALAFAGVYYMHPLTLVAFGAVPAVYVLWFGRSGLWRIVARLAAAHVLGLGICLMHALPSHFFMPWIHAERFLDYSWRDNLFHIDVLLCAYYGIAALLMGVAIWKVPALKESPAAKEGIFWIIVIAAVFFMTQKMSAPIWQFVTPLQYLQFPAARLHATAFMGAVWLICLWLSHYRQMLPLGDVAYRRTTLALLITGFTVATGWRIHTVESDPAVGSDSYLEDGRDAKLVFAPPGSLYETHWGCIGVKRVFALYKDKRIPPPVAVTSGAATITSLNWSPPDRITFSAEVTSPEAQLAVRQCYIPLWHGRDEAGNDIPLHADKNYGIVEFSLPRGSHRLDFSLRLSWREMFSRWLSAFALAASLGLTFRPKTRQADVSAA